MPIAHLHILDGRSTEVKRKLIRSVTDAISNSLDINSDKVRILLHEIPKEHWATGGTSKKDPLEK